MKLKKNSDEILNMEFKIAPKGYDGLEVDSYLDQIVKDYLAVEQNYLLSVEEYKDLKARIEKLDKENIELKIKLEKEKGKWKYIKNDEEDIHIDNLVLLQRIGKLEQYIYEKLHINPNEITFDPDDY